MDARAREALALGVALTFLAGWVDATGFLRLPGLFVSFMSGNSTQAAVHLVRQNWTAARIEGGVVGLFVVGVAAGRLIARGLGAWSRAAVLWAVALLLAGAMAVSAVVVGRTAELFAGALMVLAMGVQNNAAGRAGDVRLSLTYVTGTLVNLGQQLADLLRGERSEWAAYAALWGGLVLGGLAGAWLYLRIGMWGLAVPASGAALLGTLAGGLVWRGRPKTP